MRVAPNWIVAQSGGPTPVINNSLRGIIEAAREFDAWNYLRRPARHRGSPQGRTARPFRSAGRGSGPAAIHTGGRFDRHLPLQAQAEPDRGLRSSDRSPARPRIGYLLYIGGNDSMDTADKIARLARNAASIWSRWACRRRSTTTWATANSS